MAQGPCPVATVAGEFGRSVPSCWITYCDTVLSLKLVTYTYRCVGSTVTDSGDLPVATVAAVNGASSPEEPMENCETVLLPWLTTYAYCARFAQVPATEVTFSVTLEPLPEDTVQVCPVGCIVTVTE